MHGEAPWPGRMLPLRRVRPLEIPLPTDWPKHAKAALVSAAGILHYVLTYVHGWASTSPLADLRVRAERERLEAELGLLREQLRIKDARITQLERPTKPHYLPHLRLAILMLQAGRAWSAAQQLDASGSHRPRCSAGSGDFGTKAKTG